jgi:hypothetical protein
MILAFLLSIIKIDATRWAMLAIMSTAAKKTGTEDLLSRITT